MPLLVLQAGCRRPLEHVRQSLPCWNGLQCVHSRGLSTGWSDNAISWCYTRHFPVLLVVRQVLLQVRVRFEM